MGLSNAASNNACVSVRVYRFAFRHRSQHCVLGVAETTGDYPCSRLA